MIKQEDVERIQKEAELHFQDYPRLWEFLTDEVSVQNDYHDLQVYPHWVYLSYLVVANGGWRVHGWGFLSTGEHGHRRGLEQNEALHLIEMSGVMLGWCMALDVKFFALFNNHLIDPYHKCFERESSEVPKSC